MSKYTPLQHLRPSRWLFLLITLVVGSNQISFAKDELAKYALLVAVTTYDHAEMNGQRPLQFPEEDARALGKVLEKASYKVEYLLGKQATKSAIEKKLGDLRLQGNSDGICMVGFFGHGVEIERKEADGSESIHGCFCPVGTEVRQAVDKDGKPLFSGSTPMIDADPETLITMEQVLRSLKIAKAAHRVVIADCCRELPNRARGRNLGLGASFKAADLPSGTVVLFGCKPGEKALERDDWKHGAFTKCLLEEIERIGKAGAVTTGALADAVKINVQRLTGRQQNPTPFAVDSIDLMISTSQSETLTLSLPSDLTNSLGMKLKLIPAGEFLMGTTESKEDLERMGFPISGDAEFFDQYPQHRVEIGKPFYLGAYEVTLGQFLQYYNADRPKHKTDAERNGTGGWGYDSKTREMVEKPEFVAWNTGWNTPVENYMDHPVVNVSWNDADRFCKWLTDLERNLGRISNDQKYQLPTEAQWEYACRGGSRVSMLFSFGNSFDEIIRYCNVGDLTAQNYFGAENWGLNHPKADGTVFTSRVGSYAPNTFGLYDMHGNVSEWCADWYEGTVYAARKNVTRDPIVLEENVGRVFRGGDWSHSPVDCRSASRNGSPPGTTYHGLGFRISLTTLR